VNSLIINNFLLTLLLPTRITNSTSTLIDHIYYYETTKARHCEIFSGNLFSDVSDHLPNFILIKSKTFYSNYINTPFIRLYSPKNKLSFSDKLSKINWTEKFVPHFNVNDCYNAFITCIGTLIDFCFPLVKVSRRAVKDKVWMTKSLKNSSKIKN